jgi:spore coat protein CotF
MRVIIKAIDLGLMSEHLMVHKGVLGKLELYFCVAEDERLKQILYEQAVIMKNHVKVMVRLIGPETNEGVTSADLQNFEPLEVLCKNTAGSMSDLEIALEGRNGAKSMADTNFSSALNMKTPEVRRIHVQMALQQTGLQDRYSELIRERGWEYAPDSSRREQEEAVRRFNELFRE